MKLGWYIFTHFLIKEINLLYILKFKIIHKIYFSIQKIISKNSLRFVFIIIFYRPYPKATIHNSLLDLRPYHFYYALCALILIFILFIYFNKEKLQYRWNMLVGNIHCSNGKTSQIIPLLGQYTRVNSQTKW